MPEFEHRATFERKLSREIRRIFRRWSDRITAGDFSSVSTTPGEADSIRDVITDAFGVAALRAAGDFGVSLDLNVRYAAARTIDQYTGELVYLIERNTNAIIDREAEKASRLPESALAATILAGIKKAALSVKRAVTIAITEVTRIVTMAETLIARAFSGQRSDSRREPGSSVPRGEGLTGETSATLDSQGRPIASGGGNPPKSAADGGDLVYTPVAKWKTERDGRVCNLCGPLHNREQSSWPVDAGPGPPRHARCRCWVEWELKPL